MLTPYGRREWTIILVGGLVLAGLFAWLQIWWLAALCVLAALALLSFFRDPPRRVPTHKGIIVSPADGRISSIHDVGHYEPLGEPAVCIRIFLSVLNVHVNRAPCYGLVHKITPKAGQFLNALNPKSAEVNECNSLLLVHPVRKTPILAIRQVSGAIARTIVCGVREGEIVQRGQRFGMIKFGSTTEVYLPKSFRPEVQVQQGQHVVGGITVLAKVNAENLPDPDEPGVAQAERSRVAV